MVTAGGNQLCPAWSRYFAAAPLPPLLHFTGIDTKAQCACWNTLKPLYAKMEADPDYATQVNQLKLASQACAGFATSPGFLLVAAAAVSMTLFTMRNPLE